MEIESQMSLLLRVLFQTGVYNFMGHVMDS